MSRVVINGASGGVHPRMNINDFVKPDNAKQFSLFIQALSAMQSEPRKDPFSWFALGGIHGYPYQSWPGGGSAVSEPTTTQWKGYCTHGTVLFPTWHRPYVAAVEQFIHDYAVEKAKEYKGPDSNQWADAAESLRMPYWDWADSDDVLPPKEVIEYETVSIVTPYGDVKVSNPLYSFDFGENRDGFPQICTGDDKVIDFRCWRTTLRHPTGYESSAKSDVATLKKTLTSNAPQIQESVYRMLKFVRQWENFSNHTDSASTDISLEGIHDTIHNLIGGGGHMSEPAMAGFDPIFFLHHCNVDRLLSEWTAQYPKNWVTPGRSHKGTYTIPANTSIDALTALTPFANTQKSFWSSSSLRTTDMLGYTYSPIATTSDSNSLVAESISQLFPSAPHQAQRPSPPSGVYDWKVRVRVKEFELRESHQVLIFLGSAPDDHRQWMGHENYVGCVGIFVNGTPESCPNCAARPDKIVQNIVYLTAKIIENRSVGFGERVSRQPGSLHPDAISPYLEQMLTWRVRKVMGGIPVPLSDVPSLEVTVFSTHLTQEEGATFPTQGETIHHEHITRGKMGGYIGIAAAV